MLRWHLARHDVQVGVTGFGQRDSENFDVLFNDGSNAPISQTLKPSGYLTAAYLEDTYKATDWLQLRGRRAADAFRRRGDRKRHQPALGAHRAAARD